MGDRVLRDAWSGDSGLYRHSNCDVRHLRDGDASDRKIDPEEGNSCRKVRQFSNESCLSRQVSLEIHDVRVLRENVVDTPDGAGSVFRQ